MRSPEARFFRPGRKRPVVLLALGLGISAIAAAEPRLVAVGDVHGDLPSLRAILADAGLIDASGAWAGGDSTLVQLGDLIDRGPAMRGTLDFVMALEKSAAAGGGRVAALLGNHEIMNMTGDLRYVAAENYAEFADSRSEKRRAEAWDRVREFRTRRARELGLPEPNVGPAEREEWFKAHPAGFLERQEAFGPEGMYGRWLRAKPAAALLDRTAFLHGGISAAYAGQTIDEINRRVRDDLAAFDSDRALFVSSGWILPFFDFGETTRALREGLDALRGEQRKLVERFLDWGSWTINAADGPLWFRGYSQWDDSEGEKEIPRLLAGVGASRFVVGHTVQPGGRIRERFRGRVFLIDTGMLDGSFFPGGRASALEFSDGSVAALYPGKLREVLEPAPAKKAAARS